jgi:hypothetical protein
MFLYHFSDFDQNCNLLTILYNSPLLLLVKICSTILNVLLLYGRIDGWSVL